MAFALLAANRKVPAPKNILITGASSGLGRALALNYADSGVSLWLSGRDAARLEEVVQACRKAGARAEGTVLDVTDREAVMRWVRQADAAGGVDLAFANAGISAGTGGGDKTLGIEPPEQSARVFATNMDGVRHTVEAVVETMRANGSGGQIALLSSMAGFRGLPGSASYSATKAAVRVWGEALRGSLAAIGIRVNVICPGYVATPMTDRNHFKMPFLVQTDHAVAVIRRGLARNKARIAFPKRMYAVVWLLAALPPSWTDRFFTRLPEKDVLPD